jgi:hypothetical protein
MFDVQVCPHRNVALFTFRGELSEADFAKLDAMAREARGGPSYHLIFDMTLIEKSQLDTDLVAKRGHLRPADPNRVRIYIAPQHDLKLLVRLYGAYQETHGWKPPLIMATRKEAFERLQVTDNDFQPVPV